MFEIDITPCPPHAFLIAPKGDLDYSTMVVARERITAVMVNPQEVSAIWDLRQVVNVDSSGLALFLWHTRLLGKQHVALLGAPDRVRRMLRVSGLDTMLVVVADVPELARLPGWDWATTCAPLAVTGEPEQLAES